MHIAENAGIELADFRILLQLLEGTHANEKASLTYAELKKQTKFVVDKVTELQEKLTAGSNITITNGTISATVPAANNISSNDWSTLWQ